MWRPFTSLAKTSTMLVLIVLNRTLWHEARDMHVERTSMELNGVGCLNFVKVCGSLARSVDEEMQVHAVPTYIT
ncbi:hypothetical protein C8Q74DRAFT_728541 [Fomes fomentarius]|nr:hypothetical protein C8Q74DRAFT_728541 [Fomes fomentarius]